MQLVRELDSEGFNQIVLRVLSSAPKSSFHVGFPSLESLDSARISAPGVIPHSAAVPKLVVEISTLCLCSARFPSMSCHGAIIARGNFYVKQCEIGCETLLSGFQSKQIVGGWLALDLRGAGA